LKQALSVVLELKAGCAWLAVPSEFGHDQPLLEKEITLSISLYACC
jgi:hypothetical protein